MGRYNVQLKGGDLRSIGKVDQVVAQIRDQADLDELFNGLFSDDRKVVMRTADAIEKVTLKHPVYLRKHKEEIIAICNRANAIELKWHLAQLLPRLDLTAREAEKCWQILSTWAIDRNESRIVRVNSVQGLFELSERMKKGRSDFDNLMDRIEKEKIPSINARIRKLRRTTR